MRSFDDRCQAQRHARAGFGLHEKCCVDVRAKRLGRGEQQIKPWRSDRALGRRGMFDDGEQPRAIQPRPDCGDAQDFQKRDSIQHDVRLGYRSFSACELDAISRPQIRVDLVLRAG